MSREGRATTVDLGPAVVPKAYYRLVFAKGDRAYRDAMRNLVREKESDGRNH